MIQSSNKQILNTGKTRQKSQPKYILGNKDMHLNFLSAPMMPISMFFAEICPSNLENANKRKTKAGLVSKTNKGRIFFSFGIADKI